MKSLLSILNALGDETRLRAFLLLRGRELCLCQIIEVLGLAPSTVSRHMAVLHQAGLVDRRKEGKWHYYRHAQAKAPALVRKAIRLALDGAAGDPVAASDEKRCRGALKQDLVELCACYRS